jgi:16S rRNA (uracil1498-N3)-methyltransferase
VQASLKFRDDSTTLLLAQQSETESGKGEPETEPSANSKLMIFVGPEGGFDVEEIEMLRDANAGIVHLGGRRLRTAVAVNAALCHCLQLSGEIKRF